MPGWAVSVGLLDSDFDPIGGVVYAPKWGSPAGDGTLLFSDKAGSVYLNDTLLSLTEADEHRAELYQLMVSSHNHKDWNLKHFPGKLRNTGGAVLNIAAVILYYRVIGALVSPCHIWDLAAAHGILKNAGLFIEYISGKKVNYRVLLNGENAEEYMLAGTRENINILKSYILSSIPS